jgi:hypothetical protein
MFEHKWRKNNECEEMRTMFFRDVEVADAWLWCTEKNWQLCDFPEKTWLDSLSSEEIIYMMEDGPKCAWKDGFCSSKKKKKKEKEQTA